MILEATRTKRPAPAPATTAEAQRSAEYAAQYPALAAIAAVDMDLHAYLCQCGDAMAERWPEARGMVDVLRYQERMAEAQLFSVLAEARRRATEWFQRARLAPASF